MATFDTTIKYWAVHALGEHPRFGFPTKEEARAFINGYALACGHDGKDVLCKGALAEWSIEEAGIPSAFGDIGGAG